MRFVSDLQRAVLHSEMPPAAGHITLTLAVLADWDTGVIPDEFSPSLDDLVSLTRLSKSTVAEWLGALEVSGWLKRERPDRASKYVKTRYTLLIGSPTVAVPQRASRRTARAGASPGGAATPGADRVPSPHGGPLADPARGSTASPGDRPPSGPVRQADRSSSPPSGTPAVRHAGSSGPPGGPRSIKNSPTESSPSKDMPDNASRPATPVPADRRATTSRPPAGRSAGIPLPDDFAATDAMIEWARRNTPNVGLAETAAFVDYWQSQSGAKARRPDLDAWVMTWRNWMRKEQKTIERASGFRGTAVQTAVAPTVPSAPAPAADPMCPRHPGLKARYCCPGSVPNSARAGRAASPAQGRSDAVAA